MKRQSAAYFALRCAQGAFLVFMAVYCLLAYLPFTYHQITQGNLLPWVGSFARFAPLLWLIAAALGAWPFRRLARRQPVKIALWAAAQIAAAIWLAAQPIALQVQTPALALGWSVAAFVSLGWTGWLDWLAAGGELVWPRGAESDGRLFAASLASAVFVTVSFAVAAIWRMRTTGSGAEHALGAIFSLDAHVFAFMGMFAILALGRALALATARPAAVEFWFDATAAVLAIVSMLSRSVFPVLSFDGAWALTVSVSAAVASVLFWCGLCARLRAADGRAGDGLEIFLLPLSYWIPGRSPLPGALGLVLASAAGCYLSAAAAGMDWNYLLQKASASVSWLVVFSLFYALAGNRKWKRTAAYLMASIALLGLHRVVMAHGPDLESKLTAGAGGASAIGKYAGYNASFKLLYDWMTPAEGSEGYYKFLAANTNLPRERELKPVEVRLRARLDPAAGPRPNIFLFVLDSLRPDYLAPYNPQVTFTPALAAFGKESLVFEHAFTRYAGTGLSEPSIWSGAMLPHKQYVVPFHPMNSLEKLLDACGYRRFVSMDSILAALLNHDSQTAELDEGRLTMDFDLSHTVDELIERLSAAPAGPVFAYTQPQNLHISVINRAGRSVPAGESYPGFDAPYASRVKRADEAFGRFIAFLKARGLYEESVVILTSDHGDSLGESGRWGHAYSLVPEVIRIPLIMHVPEKLRSANVSNVKDAAFLTDIVPSLYELLGQGPLENNVIFGKPLFAGDRATLASYRRPSWLIVGSYAPVYGILKDGRELYVSDAVHFREAVYDLGAKGGAARGSNEGKAAPSVQRSYQDEIRRQVQAIRNFYRIEPTGVQTP